LPHEQTPTKPIGDWDVFLVGKKEMHRDGRKEDALTEAIERN